MEEQKSLKRLVNEKVTRHNGIRHCEEGKRSVARRSNLLKACEKLFRKHAPALLALSFRNNISHTNHNGNPQSLINDKNLTSYVLTTSKKAAFTLAEVLITLAVIGIVAAMTIPNLVQSYKKKEVETKLLRFYSVINNAIALSEIDNGNKTTWSEPDDFTDEEVTKSGGKSKMDAWLIKYIIPYVKITKKEVLSSGVVYLYFSDGTALRWNVNRSDIYFYINNPSCIESARCRFSFNFAPKGGTYWGYAKNKGVEPYNFNLNINNAEALCKKKDELLQGKVPGNDYCTMWIKQNGWKIPEDYPYKF